MGGVEGGSPPSHYAAAVVRNTALFVVGAFLLVVEIEFRHDARVWVIVLALVLMGIVTVDQVLEWFRHRSVPHP